MTTMVVATTTLAVATPPLKRGRPQFASLEMLSPSGLKARRARAKNKAKKQLAKLEEEGLDAPPELLELARPGKRGRPRLSDDVIDLPQHAPARRARIRCAKREQELAAPEAAAASAMLFLEAGAGAGAEEEAKRLLAAKRQAKVEKAMKQLDRRNACDNIAADGENHPLRPLAEPAACAEDCALCTEPTRARMPCCKQAVCPPCIAKWMRQSTEETPAPRGAGSGTITVYMACRQCPMCKTPITHARLEGKERPGRDE